MQSAAKLTQAIRLNAAAKAIDKQLKALDKAGDGTIEPGSYPIEDTIRVRLFGTLDKAAATEVEALPDVPWPTVLALLCARAKLGRGQAKDLIGQVVRAAIGLRGEAPDAQATQDRVVDAEAEIKAARESNRQAKSRQGNLTYSGTIDVK